MFSNYFYREIFKRCFIKALETLRHVCKKTSVPPLLVLTKILYSKLDQLT